MYLELVEPMCSQYKSLGAYLQEGHPAHIARMLCFVGYRQRFL